MHAQHIAKHALVVGAISALSAFASLTVSRVLEQGHVPPVLQPVRDAAHPREVVGLWTRWPGAQSDGDRVRFYFFHESGIGLYRFGKIGMNTTQSFDWRVETASSGERELVLTFRKTGEVKRTPFSLAGTQQRSLVMTNDPKEPLVGAIAYTFVPAPVTHAPDLVALQEAGDASSGGIGGRMWIDDVKFATGGHAFSMYQLKDTAIDGRGVGWHHVGDYDDWSTEALQYRFSPASCRDDAHLQLHFTVRDERAATPIIRRDKELVLVEDPRSYWHVRTYKDGGRSFSFLR